VSGFRAAQVNIWRPVPMRLELKSQACIIQLDWPKENQTEYKKEVSIKDNNKE
jgi:hypothetical protein